MNHTTADVVIKEEKKFISAERNSHLLRALATSNNIEQSASPKCKSP